MENLQAADLEGKYYGKPGKFPFDPYPYPFEIPSSWDLKRNGY
jgi:hypothetical protein